MKKLLLILFILPLAAFTQTPQTSYVVPTVSAMKSYYGAANRIYVVEKNSDYVQCISCTPDEVNIYAGAGGRKWMKFSDSAKQNILVSGANIKTINGSTILGNGDLTVSSGAIDTSHLSDRIDANAANIAINTTAITGKQDAITLTTTGTSGAATLSGDTLNIPQYSGGGNDTAIVHIDSILGHPSWVQFIHSNRDIPSDTMKLYVPPTIVSFTKNATKDSIIITLSDGTVMSVKDSTGGGPGGSSLSSLTAATVPNTIDNGGLNSQVWQWNSLDTTTAFTLASTSAGSAANSHTSSTLLKVATAGTNAADFRTIYGAYITNTHTGTSSTNVALYASATGAANNYAALLYGRVGINVPTDPAYDFDVRGTAAVSSIFYTNTISARSGTVITLSNQVSSSAGFVATNAAGVIQYDYTRVGVIGYAAQGNDMLSVSTDTLVAKFLNNSKTRNLGIYTAHTQFNDNNSDASTYNFNPNVIVGMNSTTKAFLPPQMTTTQRDAIVLTGVGYGTIANSGGTTAGTYNLSLTGGTGTGATAKIYTTGSGVTKVVITNIGSGYSIGDVLTATLPGTLTWSYTLTALSGVPGMQIFNLTTGKINFLNNSRVWEQVTSAP